MRVGFVGLGDQGGPIAARISAAGFPLSVWARRAEAAAPFVAAGAALAPSLEVLAETSELLGICVLDDDGVHDIAGRALLHLPRGASILILSTVHPETCRTIASRAAPLGIAVVDAPVSGGADAARAGRLTIMLGGGAESCAAVVPLLESFASLIVRLGGVGAGQTAKLINNALMAANLGLAAEAARVGSALGLERVALQRVIAASSGGSFAHGVLSRLPSLSAFGAGAALLAKDAALLDELARAAGVEVGTLTGRGRTFIEGVLSAAAASEGSR